MFAPDDAAGAAGSGTEPGPSWGGQYEHRALAAPPAPQFRSDLDSSRNGSFIAWLTTKMRGRVVFQIANLSKTL